MQSKTTPAICNTFAFDNNHKINEHKCIIILQMNTTWMNAGPNMKSMSKRHHRVQCKKKWKKSEIKHRKKKPGEKIWQNCTVTEWLKSIWFCFSFSVGFSICTCGFANTFLCSSNSNNGSIAMYIWYKYDNIKRTKTQ